MRDPKECAAKMCADVLSCGPTEADCETIADALREAQEDGAREWKAFAERVLEERREEEAKVAPVIAALTERAERAEREANEYNELLVETSSKLDDAEYERDEAMKALDAHKERADRAESELHRRKF